MFRSGGSSNEGIMHGLVDRKGYDQGSIDPKRTRADVQTELDILKEYAPMPKSRFPMGQIGLNLVSGEFGGEGFLQNLAGSLRDPYSQWTARDDIREQAIAERGVGAAGRSIAQQRAEAVARAKAAGSGIQKDYSDQRAYETAVEKRLEARSKMSDYQDVPVDLAFIRETAEYDILVLRNLRTTQDPKGREINALKKGFVPYDEATGEFDYMAMDAGAYYYDPKERAFVQKIPTTTNEAGETVRGAFYAYDKFTFEKRKLADLPE